MHEICALEIKRMAGESKSGEAVLSFRVVAVMMVGSSELVLADPPSVSMGLLA
jgi:hypothetical protein